MRASPTAPTTLDRVLRRVLVGLCWFTGLTAIGGGIELMVWSHGNEYLPPLELLDGTGFTSFLVPGVLLAGVVGSIHVVAAVLTRRRHRWGELAGSAAGVTLLVWLIVEMLLLRGFHWLHGLYLVAAAMTIVTGAWLGLRRRAAQPSSSSTPTAPLTSRTPISSSPSPS